MVKKSNAVSFLYTCTLFACWYRLPKGLKLETSFTHLLALWWHGLH